MTASPWQILLQIYDSNAAKRKLESKHLPPLCNHIIEKCIWETKASPVRYISGNSKQKICFHDTVKVMSSFDPNTDNGKQTAAITPTES